jgi:hypothetical protein
MKGCPPVADLIQYALGQASADERRRIETHLRDEDCSPCRSWIEKAGALRTELWPDAKNKPPSSPIFAASAAFSPPPATALPPVLDSTRWQQDAFRDLECRLRLLDEATSSDG